MYDVSRVSILPSALQPIETVVNIASASKMNNSFFMTAPYKVLSRCGQNTIDMPGKGTGEFRGARRYHRGIHVKSPRSR
jgi:hypothetical protein